MQKTQVPSLGQEDPLEKDMATHSSILAWRTPWTEEPGGLQSMGSQKSQTQLVTKWQITTNEGFYDGGCEGWAASRTFGPCGAN